MRKYAGGKINSIDQQIRIENHILRIVDQETWERVQYRMSDNRPNAAQNAKREYHLSGLIECQEYGHTYIGHTSRNKKGIEYGSYQCGNKYRTKTAAQKIYQQTKSRCL